EGAPEEHALSGQFLQVWRRDRMAVGLQVAARIVRVKIEDIRHRAGRGTRTTGRHHAGSHSARHTLQESPPRVQSLVCHAIHLPMASLPLNRGLGKFMNQEKNSDNLPAAKW